MHRSKVLSSVDFVFQTTYSAFAHEIWMSDIEQKEKSEGKMEVSQGDGIKGKNQY